MRIEELSPSKFYAIIVDADISLENVNNIEATMKAKGINVVVLAGDGPTGPVVQRYWGVYNTDTKSWCRKGNGEPYHYPSPTIASALLTCLSDELAHSVNGRGNPLAAKLVVKEMTAPNDNSL